MSVVHELVHAARPESNQLSEDALLRAYGEQPSLLAVPAPQACLCGGVIAPRSEGVIPAVVRAHNDSAGHAAWARRSGLR